MSHLRWLAMVLMTGVLSAGVLSASGDRHATAAPPEGTGRAEPQAAAGSGSQPAAVQDRRELNLDFIGEGFQGAVFVKVDPLRETPLRQLTGLAVPLPPSSEPFFGEWKEFFGDDVQHLEEFVGVLGLMQTAEGKFPAGGTVFRFRKPYDKEAFKTSLIKKSTLIPAKETKLEGYEAIETIHGTFVLYDDRHVLVGKITPVLTSMLAFKEAKSPLRDALKEVEGGHDVTAVFAVAELRNSVQEFARQLPPLQVLAGLVRQIETGAVYANYDSETLLKVTIKAANEDAAQALLTLWRQFAATDEKAIQAKREELVESYTGFLYDMTEEQAEEAADLVADFYRGVSVAVEKNNFVIRLQAPENLKERATKVGAALKEADPEP